MGSESRDLFFFLFFSACDGSGTVTAVLVCILVLMLALVPVCVLLVQWYMRKNITCATARTSGVRGW